MIHQLSKEILKECDIRGITGKDLSPLDAYYIGRSFGSILKKEGKLTCTVGQDGRLSSDSLRIEVIKGLLEAGIDVTYIGIVPTPMVYYGTFKLRTDSGLMVTASHNPAEYNGFKFITTTGSFHGDDIKALARIAFEGDFTSGKGTLLKRDIRREYIPYIHSFLSAGNSRRLKVVWDPGNGATAAILSDFLKDLPGEHLVICGEVDGNFPHHHPDPSLPENVKQLKAKVVEEGADLGIAFDGDGDRLGVVDGEGTLLYGDQLLVLFARDFLENNPGAVVMSEVKASQFFYDEVAALGGIPLMWKVGHTNQKEKMKAEGIGLAGETSGHIFFSENRGFDDALFAAVKLINILSHADRTLTRMVKEFPAYYDSGEIRIHLEAEERRRVVDEILERVRGAGRQVVDIDGIRVSFSGGFWMLRGSNTQPHLTIRVEARSKDGLESGLTDLYKQLELSGLTRKDYLFL
ncbi:MAG: phosphomannomutase/phosphoglucomutase [Spirochaetales bacterium]|nr:phosphomannomutase/phosphoglucomutase [Spirochaetales bacterium]